MVVRLISVYMVPLLRSASNAIRQRIFAFGIQELLQVLPQLVSKHTGAAASPASLSSQFSADVWSVASLYFETSFVNNSLSYVPRSLEGGYNPVCDTVSDVKVWVAQWMIFLIDHAPATEVSSH
jgi:hypothetical protein